MDGSIEKSDLERALLAIDIFPRCALLLTVFEKLSLDDATVLLGATKELLKKAREIGLYELARNLAPEPALDQSAILLRSDHDAQNCSMHREPKRLVVQN